MLALPQAGDLGRGGGVLKRNRHKALRGEVVNLSRLGLLQQPDARPEIGQVILDQMEIGMVLDPPFIDAPELVEAVRR